MTLHTAEFTVQLGTGELHLQVLVCAVPDTDLTVKRGWRQLPCTEAMPCFLHKSSHALAGFAEAIRGWL